MNVLPIAAAAMFCAAPALAEVIKRPQGPRMHIEAADGMGACFARVVIFNMAGRYNASEAFDTPYGQVTLHYETVRGHRPGDADIITVVEIPEGVIAQPNVLSLPDGETGEVCLIQYVGG